MRHRLVAILDTNVILDFYSVHDLEKAYEGRPVGEDNAQTLSRRVRARDALVLAWHLHTTKSCTVSLPSESLAQLIRLADPNRPDTLVTQHVQLSVWLVKDRVVCEWTPQGQRGIDSGLRGSECDDLLLRLARKHRVPLVTNEGLQTDGSVNESNPRQLRSKGRRAGVKVLTPREFWQPHITPGKATRDFLKRYDKCAAQWVRHHEKPEVADRAASLRRGILQHVFWGHTPDPNVRLPVELPRRGLSLPPQGA